MLMVFTAGDDTVITFFFLCYFAKSFVLKSLRVLWGGIRWLKWDKNCYSIKLDFRGKGMHFIAPFFLPIFEHLHEYFSFPSVKIKCSLCHLFFQVWYCGEGLVALIYARGFSLPALQIHGTMDTNNSTKNSSFRSPTLDQDLAQTLQQDWWLSTTVLPDPLGGSQKSVAVSDQTFNDSCCSTPTSTFNPWNASSLTHCFNVSSGNPDGELAQSILFWVEGILLGITGSFGIVGNILTCVVLFRISLNNVFNQLIVALAAVDSLFVALCLIEYTLKKGLKLITYTTPVYVNLWPIFIYPFHNITYSVSLFVTLAIAIER